MRNIFCRVIQSGITALLLLPVISVACSCAADPGQISEDKIIDAMCAVDVVFVGKAKNLITTTSDQTRLVTIDPIAVFRGDVSKFVVAKTTTTCDHWYEPSNDYLIFGKTESESSDFSTSICGPTRFTSDTASAQFQLSVIEENVARIDELCGAAESGARRIRIIRQDRDDRESAQAEGLRLLKEGLRQSSADYKQVLKDAKSDREVEK